ncbi:MAG: hypothetical protein KC910_18735, partial [Candidatus Eremiobacteraeota bacterium]|nr:hypothetical protein [Candidatus Eremiobacteraeota bacterium]
YVPLYQVPSLVARILRHVIAPGGPRRWAYFLRSLWWSGGRYARLAAIVEHWVKSITLQELAVERFGACSPAAPQAELVST